jgi:hypothetical protein
MGKLVSNVEIRFKVGSQALLRTGNDVRDELRSDPFRLEIQVGQGAHIGNAAVVFERACGQSMYMRIESE